MKKSVVILLHAGYWILYLFVIFVFILLLFQIGTNLDRSPIFSDFKLELFLADFALVPAVLGFYTFYSVLFTRFLRHRKIFLLFLFGILAALGSGLTGSITLALLGALGVGPSIFNDNLSSVIGITGFMAIIGLLNGGMGLLLKGFITWYEDILAKEALTQKNFEMEMALVKSQINPHFLFNTLNNIDVLIAKDATKASAYLNKLSDIMRFMLYETKTEQIPLLKEWNYLEKYIALQKIRTANPDFVHFALEGNAAQVMIAPMILIPFVENAFKYAEGIKTAHAIQIKVRVEDQVVYFECKNEYLSDVRNQQNEFSGLGNNLISKRLSLLYPNKHTLSVRDMDGVYCVDLKIAAT